MPYVYILECADGSYYTGSTWDLERRLWEHQNGLGAKHTAKRLPVKLVFCEECDRVEDAYAREKQIQGWSRKKKQALMAGDWDRVHQLAECRNMSNSRNLGFDSAQPTLLAYAQSALPGNSQPTSTDPATDNSSAGHAPTPRESHSASLTGAGVEGGRALSGVEGTARGTTDASVGPNHDD